MLVCYPFPLLQPWEGGSFNFPSYSQFILQAAFSLKLASSNVIYGLVFQILQNDFWHPPQDLLSLVAGKQLFFFFLKVHTLKVLPRTLRFFLSHTSGQRQIRPHT